MGLALAVFANRRDGAIVAPAGRAMSDIFLSYASTDRAFAMRVQRALAQAGYLVFWDQEVPPGADWDTWIRGKLSAARVVIVLWSKRSIASANVRHEAMIARDAGKLLPVLIDTLAPSDFPMGLYMVQALNLAQWKGGARDDVVQRLLAELRARNTAPRPVGQGSTPAPPPSNARASAIAIAITIAIAVIAIAVFALRPGPASHESVTAPEWAELDKADPVALRAFHAGAEGELRAQAAQALAQLEEADFDAAQKADSIDAFQAFLRNFPDSAHASAARGRIADLRQIAETPSPPAPVSHNTGDPHYLLGHWRIVTGQSALLSCKMDSPGALYLHFRYDGTATYSTIPYIAGVETDKQPLAWELNGARYRLSIDGLIWESSFNVEFVNGSETYEARVGRYSGARSGYFLLCPALPQAGFPADAPTPR